jgi:hypothetical protein
LNKHVQIKRKTLDSITLRPAARHQSSAAKQPKVEGAVFQVIWRAVEVENEVKDLVIRKPQSC